jgi:hypothetical protein
MGRPTLAAPVPRVLPLACVPCPPFCCSLFSSRWLCLRGSASQCPCPFEALLSWVSTAIKTASTPSSDILKPTSSSAHHPRRTTLLYSQPITMQFKFIIAALAVLGCKCHFPDSRSLRMLTSHSLPPRCRCPCSRGCARSRARSRS